MSENLDIKNENKDRFNLFLKDNLKKIIILIAKVKKYLITKIYLTMII